MIGLTDMAYSETLVTVSGAGGSGYLRTSGFHNDMLGICCTAGELEWRLCYGSTITGGTVLNSPAVTIITNPHDTPFQIKIFRFDTHAIVDLWGNDGYISGFYRKNQSVSRTCCLS